VNQEVVAANCNICNYSVYFNQEIKSGYSQIIKI